MTTRVCLTLILVAVASRHAGAAPDVCGQTARAARHACANATRDDYWTAVGICANTTDTVNKGGGATEDTEDFFAQDVDGNVWYFGELSQEFENGELTSLEGSWRAGMDGASPGIIMRAMPAVGDTYRQEFAFGNAEDAAAEVQSTTGSATVPATSCAGTCLVTREFTPLEPGADEQKYYAPGIGMILEVETATGVRNELVSFSGGGDAMS